MDTTKFLKQIRAIIREEIEYALDKKMNESRLPKNDRDSLEHGMSLMKELGMTKKQTQSKQKSKTGLTSIQDILNETRMSMQSALDEEEWPEIRLTSDSIRGEVPNMNMIPNGYKESEITPEVSKALTRDYSALMAKINEKKGR